jgi:hypothetical protein
MISPSFSSDAHRELIKGVKQPVVVMSGVSDDPDICCRPAFFASAFLPVRARHWQVCGLHFIMPTNTAWSESSMLYPTRPSSTKMPKTYARL